jgi:hypothetical protein
VELVVEGGPAPPARERYSGLTAPWPMLYECVKGLPWLGRDVVGEYAPRAEKRYDELQKRLKHVNRWSDVPHVNLDRRFSTEYSNPENRFICKTGTEQSTTGPADLLKNSTSTVCGPACTRPAQLLMMPY